MAANGWFFTVPTGWLLACLVALATLYGLALLSLRLSRVPTSDAQTQREASFLRVHQQQGTRR